MSLCLSPNTMIDKSTKIKMGHKVLAVDYRGFADSTELEDITETSVVEDAAAALRYLR